MNACCQINFPGQIVAECLQLGFTFIGPGTVPAVELLGHGHQVAVSARSSEPLQELARRFPGQVLVAIGDLTDADQVRKLAAPLAKNAYGQYLLKMLK